METHILQVLIFNEQGTDIEFADALLFNSEAELNKNAEIIVNNFKCDKECSDLGLVLMNNTTGKMLYNSKEEK